MMRRLTHFVKAYWPSLLVGAGIVYLSLFHAASLQLDVDNPDKFGHLLAYLVWTLCLTADLWRDGVPLWSMNYYGRVTAEPFSGDFLKAALYEVPADKPFRGPDIFRQGDYTYHCQTSGDFEWFQGYEDIFYLDKKIYELYFHGGVIV